MSLYLYHATDKNNLESIKQNGLLINPPKHSYEKEIGVEILEGKIFLALESYAAEAYAECADECPENVVVLKVDLEALNQNDFDFDYNNRCEYDKYINSCVYKSDIPGNLLQECDPAKEPFQDIYTFKGTNMYETIMRIYDKMCETGSWNLEETNIDLD
ncbi:MAG: hypothetical protein K6D02_02180 [Lachnospiraceae bacterium]|nr:hypothetical protein [Lachnospiraceae bacterium]